jgi:glycosyltransferase involved in cell wall biosynthesis
MKQITELADMLDCGPEGESRPRRICFVTPELAELHQNGGIGTATSGLIEVLCNAGHSVDIFYTGSAPRLGTPEADDPKWRSSVDGICAAGVTIHFFSQSYDARFQSSPRQISYACYDYLKNKNFDIVHFADYGANGYYSCLAKKCRAAFENTVLITTVHGPKRWASEADLEFISDLALYELAELEHRAISNSDICVAVSASLIRWLAEHGVALPERTYLHKNCHPKVAPGTPEGLLPGELRRLVFFGRLDRRKGIDLFVRALHPFLRQHPQIEVLFLGRHSKIDGEHSAGFVLHRLSDTHNPLRFLNRLGRDAALRELRKPGTLAVMPSYDENSPCVVVECQTIGVPFLTTDVGGIAELIAPADRAAVLVPADARALTERFEAVWRDGHPAARPYPDAAEIAETWARFHRVITPITKITEDDPALPLVTICVTHYRRPHLLPQLLTAIEAQTYPNLEIVLVDDGSGDTATGEMLASLKADTRRRLPLTIKEIPNSYLGAARNAAVSLAHGEFLKFQDDDNLPLPNEVELLVRAAQATNSDVVTCFSHQFAGAPPSEPSIEGINYFPIGDAGALGYVKNEFGDANSLVRTKTFRKLGGFTEDRGVGCEDYEFFARCVSNGYRVVCVPEPLFFYRVSANSMLQQGSIHHNAMRGRRGFADFPVERLKVFADLALGRHIREQTEVEAWYRVGRYRHGWLHQQLLEGDPNSELSDQRIVDMMGLYGRVEDALRHVIDSRSISAGLQWIGGGARDFITRRNESAAVDHWPIVLDFCDELGVETLAPLKTDLPSTWHPDWPVVDRRKEGLLVHPVGTLTTVARLPRGVPAGVRRIVVRWIHIHPAGGPAEVSIGLDDDTGLQSDWVRICHEDGPLDMVLRIPPQTVPRDLIFRSRAVDQDSFVWTMVRAGRMEFDSI